MIDPLDELAAAFTFKANVLGDLGDQAGAVGLYDRALAVYEHLVDREGRSELADRLAKTFANKAIGMDALGDQAGAVGLY